MMASPAISSLITKIKNPPTLCLFLKADCLISGQKSQSKSAQQMRRFDYPIVLTQHRSRSAIKSSFFLKIILFPNQEKRLNILLTQYTCSKWSIFDHHIDTHFLLRQPSSRFASALLDSNRDRSKTIIYVKLMNLLSYTRLIRQKSRQNHFHRRQKRERISFRSRWNVTTFETSESEITVFNNISDVHKLCFHVIINPRSKGIAQVLQC